MRSGITVRIATLLLIASLAVPAMAAPRRDESPTGPLDRIEQIMAKLAQHIKHVFDMPVLTVPH